MFNSTPTTLFGKPLSYWGDIQYLLDEANIKDSEQLAEKLAVGSRVFEVYDAGNYKRLLGTVEAKREFAVEGRLFHMAAQFDIDWSVGAMNMTTVKEDLAHASFVRHGDHLRTSTPLSVLRKVRDFTLAGDGKDTSKGSDKVHINVYRDPSLRDLIGTLETTHDAMKSAAIEVLYTDLSIRGSRRVCAKFHVHKGVLVTAERPEKLRWVPSFKPRCSTDF